MIVKYNRPNLHYAYGIRFIPGVNSVDPKLWAIAEKDSEIQHFLNEGILEVLEPDIKKKSKEPKDPLSGLSDDEKKKLTEKAFGDNKENATSTAKPPETPPIEPLSNFNDKKALELVAQTFNVGILKEWLDTEIRSKVKRAIETQIKKMEENEPSKSQEA